ncbi:MAG: transcription antitermination factor NusB [Pseudolabrys sp.]|nr:transcription antitermination factor NusB [Pseudolabrys sp.]
MARPRTSPQPEVPGLAARRIAADILDGVLRRRTPLDELLSGKGAHPGLANLADRDRALMRRLVATVLRRLGTLRHVVGGFLDKGFPADAPRTETILLIGAAQILWLDVPDHAAVDLSVRLAQGDRRAARYAGLINAVLRRVAQNKDNALAEPATRDTPPWLLKRWTATYGADTAKAIAEANGHEPALDISVKPGAPHGADHWAERLRGRVLPTGTVRTLAHGAISLLPGFTEGAWWVQDAAAALPAHLLGDVRGLNVADLCAAPGGKTAQLAAAGARVTAVDRSAARLARLTENLARLSLTAETVAADALEWRPEQPEGGFDAVLLDAPCSSTGTIRRHPDVPWLKSEADLAVLISLQQRLLDHAVTLLKPNGTLVYCVCSLEPEEGENQIASLLARNSTVTRVPITVADVFGQADFVAPNGELRTLPLHLPDADPNWAGLDGFFAARLTRNVG